MNEEWISDSCWVPNSLYDLGQVYIPLWASVSVLLGYSLGCNSFHSVTGPGIWPQQVCVDTGSFLFSGLQGTWLAFLLDLVRICFPLAEQSAAPWNPWQGPGFQSPTSAKNTIHSLTHFLFSLAPILLLRCTPCSNHSPWVCYQDTLACRLGRQQPLGAQKTPFSGLRLL